MKQKTIRLNRYGYRFKNGVFKNGIVEYYSHTKETWKPSKRYVLGTQVVLRSIKYIGTDRTYRHRHKRFYLHFDTKKGIPGSGNFFYARNCSNGFLGAKNGHSIHAHGLREIVKIGETKSGQVLITVGPDIKAKS